MLYRVLCIVLSESIDILRKLQYIIFRMPPKTAPSSGEPLPNIYLLFKINSKVVWGCFRMSGVRMLYFWKDWWNFIHIHQNYDMAFMFNTTKKHMRSFQMASGKRFLCGVCQTQRWDVEGSITDGPGLWNDLWTRGHGAVPWSEDHKYIQVRPTVFPPQKNDNQTFREGLFVGLDVDSFLHSSFEVTWFFVQNTYFVQDHVVARGLDVYVLGYFWRGGAWTTMFEKLWGWGGGGGTNFWMSMTGLLIATSRERSIRVISLTKAVVTAEMFGGKYPVLRSKVDITSTDGLSW